MGGETGKFRGSFLGGFNRQDVVNYIEQMSAERQSIGEERESFREKTDEFESRIFALEQENEALRAELEEERAKNFALQNKAAEEALLALNELKSKFASVRADVGLDVNHTKRELERMSAGVTGVTGFFEETEKRIASLEDEIAAMRTPEEGAEEE